MSTPIHVAAHDLCAALAHALNLALPVGFRGKIEVTIDGSAVKPENVAVMFRPPQPKAGMKT